MKKKSGFTVLEIIIVGTFSLLLLILFFVQKSNMDTLDRDEKRKTAINAMFFSLEESFYATNGYYPEYVSEENLTTMDPALFTDPLGYQMNAEGCSYIYEPADCTNGQCKKYILKAQLESGDTYYKESRN